MDEKQLLKFLLKVDNSIAFVINLKTLMISVAYSGEEDLCKNGKSILKILSMSFSIRLVFSLNMIAMLF